MPIYEDDKKTKDGRLYYFVVNYTENGNHKKHKSKRFRTKGEARKEEAKFLLSIGQFSDKDQITFEMLIDQYLKKKKDEIKPQSFKKLETLCQHISSCLGSVSVNKMNNTDYERFIAYIKEKAFSVEYSNKLITYMNSLMSFAFKKYDITNSTPSKYDKFKDDGSAPVKPIEFWDLDQFNQFIAVVDDIRFNALFNVLYFCGLREGEANSLDWERSIDFEHNTITILSTLTTKLRNGSGEYLETSPKTKASIRTLPMPLKVRTAMISLFEYYSRFEGFCPQWKCFGGFKALPESTITKVKNRYCSLSNLKPIKLHSFRHSTASLLINNGASVVLVQKYLGHSSADLTLRVYSHLWKNKLDEIVSVIDSL